MTPFPGTLRSLPVLFPLTTHAFCLRRYSMSGQGTPPVQHRQQCTSRPRTFPRPQHLTSPHHATPQHDNTQRNRAGYQSDHGWLGYVAAKVEPPPSTAAPADTFEIRSEQRRSDKLAYRMSLTMKMRSNRERMVVMRSMFSAALLRSSYRP